jgi:hypothetical protein
LRETLYAVFPARQPELEVMAVDWTDNRRHLLLLAVISMIVIYIAVSVYGVIRDIYSNSTVFVISSGFHVSEDYHPAPTFLDRLKGLFFEPDEVQVPVQRLVIINGWVKYTDGTPFAHGLVELRSEPRVTYTDSEGYFTFENVEEGEHVINVLGSQGQVLASAQVRITRNMDIEKSILMRLEDGTYVLEVAVDVKVLEIFLEIEQDGSGEPTGNLIIDSNYEVLVYPPEDEPKAPPGTGEPPDKPDQPDRPTKPGGGAESPGAGSLQVYSTASGRHFAQGSQPAAQINIFGDNKRIAPGMSGSYRFTVDNRANDFGVHFDINLLETNNALNIPMRYRLMDNNAKRYVNADSDWHTPAEINQATADQAKPFSMNQRSHTDYTLEWFWDDRGQIDNSWGEKHAGEVVCTLTIKVSAQRV